MHPAAPLATTTASAAKVEPKVVEEVKSDEPVKKKIVRKKTDA